jgi:hypothetical protein
MIIEKLAENKKLLRQSKKNDKVYSDGFADDIYRSSSKMVLISFLFNPIKKAGSRIRLQIIAINNVTETNMPKACVPLKVDAVKMKNPKNKIIAV